MYNILYENKIYLEGIFKVFNQKNLNPKNLTSISSNQYNFLTEYNQVFAYSL